VFPVLLGDICHVCILLKKGVLEVQFFQNFNELWMMPEMQVQESFMCLHMRILRRISSLWRIKSELPGVTF
jgi:hypothetical protein